MQATPLTRNRYSEESFLSSRIPLPPLAVQQALVAQIDAVAHQVATALRLREESDNDSRSLLSAMAHRADLNAQAKEASGWKVMTLSDVMRLSIDLHEVRSDQSYQNLGIYSFGRGLFYKAPIDGALTSATVLQRVKVGQFIYSRLFAFEGAYGMVSPEFDGYYTSTEYPTFDCDPNKLRPEFLVAYTMPRQTWKELAKGSKGLGNRRQRLQPAKLLVYQVRLPPLAYQNKIADVYDRIRALESDRSSVTSELGAFLPALINKAYSPELSGRSA